MEKNPRMPQVGDTLKGQYKLQRVLGEGGFGKAFSGIDVEANVPIAVKVLKLTSANDILQFSKEAFRMLKFTHPNLVIVTDYDSEEDTLPFIVMPLAENGSLDNEIKTRRGRGESMPLERSTEAIEQIGDALGYLHGKRIIHQDVKPANILLPNGTDFWLSDLGIARVLKPNDSLQARPAAYSPQYVSPEQSFGRAVLGSDQYSLGITAFQLLTGRLPFEAPNAYQLVYQHREVKPPSLVDAVQALKHGERIINILRVLDPIVQKAIAKQPEDRYDNVMTFAKTLKQTTIDVSQEKSKGKQFLGVDLSRTKTAQPRPTNEAPIRIENLIKQCVALFNEKKYPELQQVSEQAILLAPNNPDAWRYKGLSMCTYDKYEEAIPFYDRVIELDPQDVNAIWNKGNCLVKLGRPTEALTILNRALRLDPTYDVAWGDKGNALRALGRNEEALAAYDQAIRLNPGDSKIFSNKGVTLSDLGRNEEALAAYDQAIRLNPGDSKIFSNKGVALRALNRNEEALAAYDQAIQLNPKDSVVYNNKGNALYVLGRPEEALAAYDQAIQLNPGDSKTFAGKGNALLALNRNEEAIAAYDQAIRLNPGDSNVYYNKGNALYVLGRPEEALAAYDQALRLDPSNINAFSNKGSALNKLNRNEEALAAYDQAIQLNPKDSVVYYNKGVTLHDLKRYEEAIIAYDQALKLNPKYSNAYAGKGSILCVLGNYKEASACFQQAMACNPSEQIVKYIDQLKKHYHIS